MDSKQSKNGEDKKMTLNQQVKIILQQICEQYGPFTSDSDDVRRCRNLLNDLAGAYILEGNLLVRALESRVPETLLSGQISPTLLIPKLIQQLQNTQGISAENAQWAVESWAAAMSIAVPTIPSTSTNIQIQAMQPPKLTFDWVTIPAGEFLRGSDKCKDGMARNNEMPQRRIYLSVYQIARVPVTNAQYKIFVNATGRRPPPHWEKGNFSNGKGEHPVVCITRHAILAFCHWAGVRLPSEAEWEKAARGTDGRIYPWGNHPPNHDLCNFEMNRGDTTPVVWYPDGASPYGVLDMAGNVLEWVNDWYDMKYGDENQKNYYSVSPESDPQGPAKGIYNVLRGGSWRSSGSEVRAARRGLIRSDHWIEYGGFRCARTL